MKRKRRTNAMRVSAAAWGRALPLVFPVSGWVVFSPVVFSPVMFSPGVFSPVVIASAVVAPMMFAANAAAETPAAATSVNSEVGDAGIDPTAVLSDTTGRFLQDQRNEAARRLLSRGTVDARTFLRNALISPNTSSQFAVANALARDPAPDAMFVDPLFALVANRDLATQASRALAGYKATPGVLTHLLDLAAARRSTPEFARLAVIHAIGTMLQKRAAAELIDLLSSSDESIAIHDAAADGLVEMTGLPQNDHDPARWNAWWNSQKSRSDADFRDELATRQESQFDRQSSHLHELNDSVEKILRSQYFPTDLDQHHKLAMDYLRSPEPEIRQLGAELISADLFSGKPPSPAELVQLRDMVADSSPAVRGAVAGTITQLNDSASLDALLAQLKTEPDPDVRKVIATALGPMHDPQLRAVPVLIKLLNDESLSTAEAAADSLEELAHGPLANDATLSRQTAESLLAVALKRTSPEDLVARCINAIAPLRQAAVVQQLRDAKMYSPAHEGKSVRQAMVRAIGALQDSHQADEIVSFIKDDPDEEVQREGLDALQQNPAARNYVQDVGDLLRPEAARKDTVRDKAWRYLVSVFPQLSEKQLVDWQHRFKDDPKRNIVILQDIADKQKAAGEDADNAITQSQLGNAYKSLQQWDAAAEHFHEAVNYYTAQQNQAGMQTLFEEAERSYMQVMLSNHRFADAIDFAQTRLKVDPREQPAMGQLIANQAQSLLSTDVNAAKDLLKRADEMQPPLDDKYKNWLQQVRMQMPKNTSSNESGAPAELSVFNQPVSAPLG